MSTVLSKQATFNYDVSKEFDAHAYYYSDTARKHFVISRIDYCNSILLGLPNYQQDRLQSVFNVAARLICGRNRYDHITDLLRDRLHWLRVPQWITFKGCLLVYKSVNGLDPAYIASRYGNKSTIQRRSGLSSASLDDLVIPATKSKFGERSFAVGGPAAWNALQEAVKAAESINIFKSKLKIHLFGLSYDT